MKMMSQFRTSASGDSHGIPPICLRASPRDMVRFQYCSAGSDFSVRCFWILFDIARPIEPRPIHPKRDGSDRDMFGQLLTDRNGSVAC